MKSHTIIKWFLWILVGAIVVSFMLPAFPGSSSLVLQVPARLLLGWYRHLGTVPENLGPTWQGMAAGATLAVATTLALHLMLTSISRLILNASQPWKWRWSVSIMVLSLVLFATTCASVGIVHHGVWVMKNPLSYDASRGILTRAISNARQLATAVSLYQEDHAGKAPDRLEALENNDILEKGSLFRLNTIETLYQPPTVWIYLKPPDGSQNPELPVFASPFPIDHGKYVVAFSNRDYQTMDAAQYEAALKRWREASGSIQ
jgi:hypothetical protein